MGFCDRVNLECNTIGESVIRYDSYRFSHTGWHIGETTDSLQAIIYSKNYNRQLYELHKNRC